MPRARRWIAICCLVALGACDVSSGGPPGRVSPPGPTASPSPSPSPAPVPPIVLTPPSLSFASPSAAAQTVTVAESGYGGTFAVDATACAGIATVTLSPDTRTLTVTPAAAGSCAAVVRDTRGASTNLPISVAP